MRGREAGISPASYTGDRRFDSALRTEVVFIRLVLGLPAGVVPGRFLLKRFAYYRNMMYIRIDDYKAPVKNLASESPLPAMCCQLKPGRNAGFFYVYITMTSFFMRPYPATHFFYNLVA